MLTYSPWTAALLPLLVHEAATNGNYAPLAAQAEMLGEDLERMIAMGMHNSVVCAEDAPRFDDAVSAMRWKPPRSVRLPMLDGMRAICEVWPRGPVDSDFAEPLDSAVPALLLSGEFDPATPATYGAAATTGFRNGLHLVVPGQGHGQARLPCVQRVLRNFIDAGTVAGLDSKCIGQIRPRHSSSRSAGAHHDPVEGLTRSFGEVRAIDGVGFEAMDGRITGLLGPNGAGKSTTLRILYTVLKPQGGSASIDGIDVVADPLATRRRIGVLPHGAGIYPAHGAGDHRLLRPAARPRGRCARAACRRAGRGAREWKLCRPPGERLLAGRAHQGRARPRARACARNLLLDEPTNGLDVMATRALRALVLRLRAAGHRILFSSHVMQEVAALCDDIVIVDHGRVVAAGRRRRFGHSSGRQTLEDAFVAAIGDWGLE